MSSAGSAETMATSACCIVMATAAALCPPMTNSRWMRAMMASGPPGYAAGPDDMPRIIQRLLRLIQVDILGMSARAHDDDVSGLLNDGSPKRIEAGTACAMRCLRMSGDDADQVLVLIQNGIEKIVDADQCAVRWIRVNAPNTPKDLFAHQLGLFGCRMRPVCAESEHDGNALVPHAAPIEFIQQVREEQVGRARARHVAGDDRDALPAGDQFGQAFASDGLRQRLLDECGFVALGTGAACGENIHAHCLAVQVK